MNLLLLLIAMSGVYKSTSDQNQDVDAMYDTHKYEELTKDDFADIELSVKRHEAGLKELALTLAISEHSLAPLTFKELPGNFDVSGNLTYFVPQPPSKLAFFSHTRLSSAAEERRRWESKGISLTSALRWTPARPPCRVHFW
ncbi:hypothetical protein V5799_019740 [Amblyomma americanum]|uniref:Secreted protein n=1 Tax=Amblyomma americanum TaxID=6943 RepID=A0AAQ4EWH3_AMBAM